MNKEKEKVICVIQAIDGEIRWAAKRARALRVAEKDPAFYEGRRTGLTISRALLMDWLSLRPEDVLPGSSEMQRNDATGYSQ